MFFNILLQYQNNKSMIVLILTAYIVAIPIYILFNLAKHILNQHK